MNILDLLTKHGITYHKAGPQKGGEYHSACPTCGGGEKDAHGRSDRFMTFPAQGDNGTWYCRGCAKGGDAIEFLMFHEHLSFPAACEILGRALPEQQEYRTPQVRKKQQQTFQPKETAAPQTAWQEKARALVDYAAANLRANDEQLAWLADRGISSATARQFQLGYLPGENNKPAHYRSRKSWGIPPNNEGKKPDSLWIPRGIVVPQIIDNQVQRIRIRRLDADREKFLPKRKYHVMPESGKAPFLIYAGQKVVTVIEAELDGMLIHQEAGDISGVLALGNDSAKPDSAAHAALQQAALILVALDFDDPKNGRRAGGQAWLWWKNNYRHAVRWPVPIGKDPGDAYSKGLSVHDWISAALPSSWTEGIYGADCGGGEEGDAAPVAEVAEADECLAVAPGVAELGQLLQQNKRVSVDKSGGGCRLRYHPKWAEHFEEAWRRISRLVFYDPAVRDYLDDHPAHVIDGKNYWEGMKNVE